MKKSKLAPCHALHHIEQLHRARESFACPADAERFSSDCLNAPSDQTNTEEEEEAAAEEEEEEEEEAGCVCLASESVWLRNAPLAGLGVCTASETDLDELFRVCVSSNSSPLHTCQCVSQSVSQSVSQRQVRTAVLQSLLLLPPPPLLLLLLRARNQWLARRQPSYPKR
jgi:hypothetical protein